jgi:hypothetical protein
MAGAVTERGIRLLLVDDDELVLRDYGRLLRANGLAVWSGSPTLRTM